MSRSFAYALESRRLAMDHPSLDLRLHIQALTLDNRTFLYYLHERRVYVISFQRMYCATQLSKVALAANT